MSGPRLRRHGRAALCAVVALGAATLLLAEGASTRDGETPEGSQRLESPGHGGQEATAFEPEEFLMSERELEVFRALRHPRTRERFLERFWSEREPEVRAAWNKRLPLVSSEFGGATSARARVFLTAGPPQYRLSDICPPPVAAHEIWVYDEGRRQVVFVSRPDGAGFEVWSPGNASLLPGVSERELPDVLPETCPRGEELLAALSGGEAPPTSGGGGPRDPEWVEDFLAETTILPAGARPLEASVAVTYPAAVGERTAVLITFELPGSAPASAAAREFSLTGEIFGAEPADAFRAQLLAPATNASAEREPLRLSARRHLPPGAYTMFAKLHDHGGDRFFHTSVALDVPTLALQEEGWAEPGDRLFKLLPPPEGYLTGSQRFGTITTDPEISRVTFFLNGDRAMTKNRAPFSVELDLGDLPKPAEITAVAFDAAGYEIGRDRMTVNSGPHRFAIRLLSPYAGERTDEDVRVHAEVETPLGEQLSHVDFYWNESRMARLHQPPFVQTLHLPPSDGSSYVRAVAVLDDGHSAEDLTVVNTGDTIEAIKVDFVELYASVLDRQGVAVTGLEDHDFRVFENEVEQKLLRFETVDHLPVSAVVVLDSSTSMEEEIRDAEKAAAQFFEDVLEPKDRAAVIVFNDRPILRVPLTNDTVLLGNGLVGIEATGETSLYDSLIYGLYYLTGLRGKRAVILLSDGADSISNFTFDEALDFAKRSGAAIYAIGLGLRNDDVAEQTVLRKLAKETGGDCFFVESARRLDRIYAQIEQDLRSQYLLGYQSPQIESRDYRKVRVEVDRKGLEVRTVPGYYP